jgi:hypothetical protein
MTTDDRYFNREHENPSCPCMWFVALTDTDGSRSDPHRDRLAFVWGYAAALLGCDRRSAAILRSLENQKGTLVATWSAEPDHADREAIARAWWIAGQESDDAVEHVVATGGP